MPEKNTLSTPDSGLTHSIDPLFNAIHAIITDARKRIISTINQAMVMAYWNIGRIIVDEEQNEKFGQNMGIT